jgi:hypothetical protein
MPAWPQETTAALDAYYGDPDANGDGGADPSWERDHLVRIPVPWRMVASWNTTQAISRIQIHYRCAESLSRVLAAVWAHYGSQAAIEAARMHFYGGGYNFRLKRGLEGLSMHAYGAAVDFDPERNPLGKKHGPNMMPHPVIDAFAAEGWVWGGTFKKRPDCMHFQATA